VFLGSTLGGADVVGETVPETGALHVSIDLDVLHSPVASGHSLHEPGGLSYRQLRAILVEVARRGRFDRPRFGLSPP
jgi:arginase family enzyme